MSRFKDKSDKGFGDTVARFTKATKIDTVAKKVSNFVGLADCGCEDRKKVLNEIFPYKKSEP